MPFLFVLLYGLISGLTELMPVSSLAHQSLLIYVFGVEGSPHLLNLFLHLSSLLATALFTQPTIRALMRKQRSSPIRRHRTNADRKYTYDLHFLKAAAFSLLIGMVIGQLFFDRTNSLLLLCLLFLMNGIILIVPEYMRQGNRTAKHLNQLDAILFGFLSVLGALPGLSRIAVMSSYGSARGVDKATNWNWVLVLTIPALAILTIFDLVGIFAYGVGTITFGGFMAYLLGAILAFFGTCGSILLIRFMTVHIGLSVFAYYSFGSAALTLFLYLTV